MTSDVNVVISHSEYTVLVVDDVVSNVLLLKVLLTNEKFKVITAGNGKEALSQAVNARPDLILLDVMMPEMNGFEVAERLKADPETQHIPIIFLTALNTTADIVKGFKVGANDFISKPFNKEELVIRVTHQISLVAAKRIIMEQTEELRKIIMGRDKLYSVIAHDLRSALLPHPADNRIRVNGNRRAGLAIVHHQRVAVGEYRHIRAIAAPGQYRGRDTLLRHHAHAQEAHVVIAIAREREDVLRLHRQHFAARQLIGCHMLSRVRVVRLRIAAEIHLHQRQIFARHAPGQRTERRLQQPLLRAKQNLLKRIVLPASALPRDKRACLCVQHAATLTRPLQRQLIDCLKSNHPLSLLTRASRRTVRTAPPNPYERRCRRG